MTHRLRRTLATLVWVLIVPVLAIAQATKVASSGTLPGSCTVGNVYVKTGTSAGMYVCLATNTWTGPLASGTGGSVVGTTAVGSEPGSPATGDVDLYSNGVYVARYSGAAWVPWGPMFPFIKPVDADFAWVNQGSATVNTTNGGVFLRGVASTGANLRIRKKAAPSTPYTITAAFQWFHAPNTSNAQECGLLFRESSTGKVLTFGMTQSSGTNYWVSQYWTDATTYSSPNYLVTGSNVTAGLIWFRIADDATNRVFSFSFDGQHYVTYNTTGRTVNLTADEVGFYVQETSNEIDTGMLLYSWQQG